MTGHELREWRGNAGLTQNELAGWMGCSVRTLQEIERANEPLRHDQQLAVDFASMNIALDRKDGRKLTMTALKTWVALEHLVTPEIRALIDFEGVRPVLTQVQQIIVDAIIRTVETQQGAPASLAQRDSIARDYLRNAHNQMIDRLVFSKEGDR